MSVYKRGRTWWYKFTFDGKLIRESSRQNNKRAAEEMEAAHRTRLARGEVGISTRKHITLSELAETFKAFIETRSAERPETIKFYRSKLRRLLEYKALAEARIHTIDETLIEQYVQCRRASVSPASVNRELATLRRMLQLAWKKWKLIPAAPHISLLNGERNREFVLSREAEEQYLAAAAEPLKTAAVVMLDSGLRIGELVCLKLEDISFEPAPGARLGYIQIRHGKTKNAKRVLSMTERVNQMLRARSVSAGAYIFYGRHPDRPVSIGLLEQLHRKARASMGLSREFVIHGLRHTFGTRLGEVGTEAFTIMRLMGHVNVTISQRYVHPTPATMERAFEGLDLARLVAPLQMEGTVSGTGVDEEPVNFRNASLTKGEQGLQVPLETPQ